MATESNKQIVLRYLDLVVSRGDARATRELVAEDIVFNSPYTPEPLHGREAFAQMIGGLRASFPDLCIEEHAALAEGDLVATRWTASGTHTAQPFASVAASGKRFSISGMSIYRLRDGRIVEGWVNDDNLGLLAQLGAIPAQV